MNDTERDEWIDNDEGLYGWWKSSGESKQNFIRANRVEIDRTIDNMLSGDNRPHYLKYGG